LSADEFHRFWNAIDIESGDPLLPIKLCQAIRSESFLPPLFAALCSPNLLVAVNRIARYKTLVAPMRLDVSDTNERVTIEFVWNEPDSNPPVSLVVTELLFVVTLARMGTREHLEPLSVRTKVVPDRLEAYTDFLGVKLQKGGRHCVVFSKRDALRPFLTSNEGMWRAFEPELRTRLAELDGSVRVGQRVRSALLEALPGGGVEMDAVAKMIGMSRRSLQRHLEAEGQTYKDLLQNTRLALAQHYLLKTELPTAEISYLLGFEEPTSFYRAFRVWTGQTPESVRLSRN
jgi:AraC-like DNA-binding protein